MTTKLTREEAIQDLKAIKSFERYARGRLALDIAIEALEREDHDGCDGCRYEANHELSLPCVGCKQNYVDKYVPMPEHDREWIIGCIKHDGFVKTDRGDKANQIILDALSADNTSTNTSTKSTNISTDTSADRPRGEWVDTEFEKIKRCSRCSTEWGIYSIEEFDFCPSCGADMRGGTK